MSSTSDVNRADRDGVMHPPPLADVGPVRLTRRTHPIPTLIDTAHGVRWRAMTPPDVDGLLAACRDPKTVRVAERLGLTAVGTRAHAEILGDGSRTDMVYRTLTTRRGPQHSDNGGR